MPAPWTRQELHEAACQNVNFFIEALNLANQIKNATAPGKGETAPYYVVDNLQDTILTGTAANVLPMYDEAKSNGSLTVS